MKHIWAPWRMEYIMKHEHKKDCIFCTALEQEDGPQNLVLYRAPHAFAILNRYPYSNGHLMVVPAAHEAAFELLDLEIRHAIMDLMAQSVQVLTKVYSPEGFNVGANIGSAAGAGIADHVHFHIVPRWSGDTNFMASVGQTRVLPETLEDTYQRLRQVWTC
jgi:ATP adenylyltransferase